MSGDTPADYASVAGSAQASSPRGDTPADYAAVAGSAQASSPRGDTPADYAAVALNPQTPPPVASHAPEASGFDWTSAAIGAGAAGLLIVISLGGATAASRLRLRTTRS
jgi:hypothetical protein